MPEISTGPTDPSALDDLTLIRLLKPYLLRCLKLNHDVSNPLAGILGYCEYMIATHDNLSDEQRHQLKQIMECAERIRILVDELGAKKIALSEHVDVRALLSALDDSGA